MEHSKSVFSKLCCLLWQKLLVINQEICLGLTRSRTGLPWAKTNPTHCWISAVVCSVVSMYSFISASLSPAYCWMSKCCCNSSRIEVAGELFSFTNSCTWMQLVQGQFACKQMSIIGLKLMTIKGWNKQRQLKTHVEVCVITGLMRGKPRNQLCVVLKCECILRNRSICQYFLKQIFTSLRPTKNKLFIYLPV